MILNHFNSHIEILREVLDFETHFPSQTLRHLLKLGGIPTVIEVRHKVFLEWTFIEGDYYVYVFASLYNRGGWTWSSSRSKIDDDIINTMKALKDLPRIRSMLDARFVKYDLETYLQWSQKHPDLRLRGEDDYLPF